MSDSKWMEMYTLFRQESHKSIELHAEHFKNFVTIIIAISAATLTGAYYYRDDTQQLGLILIIGGVVGMATAYLARKLCDGFYLGMLEGITVSSKLEDILELNQRPESLATSSAIKTFESDKSLLPIRWVENRKNFSSSKEFIDAHMNRGSNKFARLAFAIVVVLYSLLLIGGIYCEYGACKEQSAPNKAMEPTAATKQVIVQGQR